LADSGVHYVVPGGSAGNRGLLNLDQSNPMTKLRISLVGLITAVLLTRLFAAGPDAGRAERAKKAGEERLQYAASPEYDPYNTDARDSLKRSNDLLEKKDFAGAIEETKKGLTKDRLNIRLLMLQAAAYRAQGDTAKADEVRKRWFSLIDSILGNGDGRSFETAFQVISVDEEYALTSVMGLEVTGQALVENNGSEFDELHVKNAKTGDAFDLYFNVDLPKRWLAKQFAPAKN
jgi:hypothetical protein